MAHAEPLEEPQSPTWLTALGIALFLLAGLVIILSGDDETTDQAQSKAQAPVTAIATAAPAANGAAQPSGLNKGLNPNLQPAQLQELREKLMNAQKEKPGSNH